jgi:hypothetical protein
MTTINLIDSVFTPNRTDLTEGILGVVELEMFGIHYEHDDDEDTLSLTEEIQVSSLVRHFA